MLAKSPTIKAPISFDDNVLYTLGSLNQFLNNLSVTSDDVSRRDKSLTLQNDLARILYSSIIFMKSTTNDLFSMHLWLFDLKPYPIELSISNANN